MNDEVTPGLRWLAAGDPPSAFPDIEFACREPDGLLAAGGDLSSARLLYAYRHGIFPWYEDGQPILWWSPDPRCVLQPARYHVAKRLRRWLKDCPFEVRFNTAFAEVVSGCAGSRLGQHGTWITADMFAAYQALQHEGWAHSVEVWNGQTLVGGLYGISIGRVFFGESMFSRESNASKIAMLALCRLLAERDFALFDCQVVSAHLLTLGAETMARRDFRAILDVACEPRTRFSAWPAAPLLASTLANA
jgi:leucyl/phenylalanyl-tRNA---protein transferase